MKTSNVGLGALIIRIGLWVYDTILGGAGDLVSRF